MKNRIVTLTLLLNMLVSIAFGQSFMYHSDSPFGIQTIREDSSRAAQNILFTDSDNDGDLDLFITGIDVLVDFETWEGIQYFIEMQENIGDRWNPQFGERVDISADFPFPLGYFFPCAGDVNGDGNADFVVNAIVDFIGNRTATYLRNSGTSGPNQFEVVRFDDMGLPDFVPESFFVPELVDLDSDGDMDILMSGFDPAFGEEDGADVPLFYYARNVGTKSDPVFEGWHSNPYGLVPSPIAELLTSGDIDNDGDIDLLGAGIVVPADSMNYLYLHVNTPGFVPKPLFNTVLQSPYGLPSTFGQNQLIFPDLVDIDGDGDLDLFVFKGNADNRTFSYYENGLCSTIDNTVVVFENVLTASFSGGIYQWLDCDTGEDIPGATNQFYEPALTGNYAVHLTDHMGCANVSECLQVTVTRTNDVNGSDSITVYPNPTEGVLNILISNPSEIVTITLLNLEGKTVGGFYLNAKHQVDLSSFEQGVYFMKIQVDDQIIVKKVAVYSLTE